MIAAFLLSASALWPIPAAATDPLDVLLMRAWYAQNEACRGDPNETPACAWRDDTQYVLERHGWTWSSRYGWVRSSNSRSGSPLRSMQRLR
jgi:hypothetical protein